MSDFPLVLFLPNLIVESLQEIIVKALAGRALSTRCPVQGSPAITPRPEKRVSSVSLDSDLKSRFLYAEQMFSAAFENSFAERWTAWPFFSYSLASVVIQFSILFHSESGFGCLGGIYVSTVPVCAWGKKIYLFPRFFKFPQHSSFHYFLLNISCVWCYGCPGSVRLTRLPEAPPMPSLGYESK